MTIRSRSSAILLGAAAVTAAIALARHSHRGAGRHVPGGILIRDAARYDTLTHRFLLGPFFGPVAADIAAAAPIEGRALEVGCGPGHLSIRLAFEHGLDVTGVDLDPAMVERARINAEERPGDGTRPSFLVGDVASLPFPDRSFDVVVSTLSMHHWADPEAGLVEIGRVLRPGGRALVWDFRRVRFPGHGRLPDPTGRARATSLRVVGTTPWRWPWRLRLTERIELTRREDVAERARRSA